MCIAPSGASVSSSVTPSIRSDGERDLSFSAASTGDELLIVGARFALAVADIVSSDSRCVLDEVLTGHRHIGHARVGVGRVCGRKQSPQSIGRSPEAFRPHPRVGT